MSRAVAAAERRPGCGPVWSQSMTVPSQLSLGTKQKAHQEQDREEKAEGRRMVLVTPALSQGLLMKCQPRAQTARSMRVQLHSSYRLQWRVWDASGIKTFKGAVWFFGTLSLITRIFTNIFDVLQLYYDNRCSPESWSSLLTSPPAENNGGACALTESVEK